MHNDYYLTEVDKNAGTIYCKHDLIAEKGIVTHKHRKGQFLYTEGGVVHVILQEKTYFLPARYYMWIPSNVVHAIQCGSSAVIMRNLYFPVEEGEDDFYQHIGIYPVNDLLMEMIVFSNRWNGDINVEDTNNYRFALALKSLLPLVSDVKLPLYLPLAKDSRLIEVIKFMDDHIQNTMLLPDLAANFGFSERSLSRLFKNDLGISFIQYYTMQRMKRALKLLLNDNLSIKEISFMVGYNSVPTFSTTFYKVLGIRPSQYIKEKDILS